MQLYEIGLTEVFQNMDHREVAIKISGVTKQYRLGQIGGGTLTHDLQSWWAKVRGREDPNSKIGTGRITGETLMALNGIDLTFYKGERVGIIGRNGAGKSTLLKLLCRVTAPTNGQIDIYGRITSMLEVGTGFHGEMTGRENIYMNGAILGMKKSEIDRKMDDIIAFSEVREFIDTPVKRYSIGMFVKLAFSVAAHLDSEILIMDEVLAVGDMAFQKKCLDKMNDVSISQGKTVLYVSHNMNTIRRLCNRCIVLDEGKVIFDGDVEKGIAIYMNENTDENYPVSHDFRQIRRQFQFGKELFINYLTFTGRNSAIYSAKERMTFEVSLLSTFTSDKLRLLFRLANSEQFFLGIMLSDEFSAEANVEKKLTGEMDISMLGKDDYFLGLEIVEINETGAYSSFDNPGVNMRFNIVDDNAQGIKWINKFWGNIRFHNIILRTE